MNADTLITKEDALDIITQLGFTIEKDTEEGAILINTKTEQAVEFFCSDAVFLIDVIKWLCTQIKIQTELENIN